MIQRVEKTITIAGGGLAGLTLGLLLRNEGVPVEVCDAGVYPRHRVCGEFFSGRGLEILKRLGLPGFPEPLGQAASTVIFYGEGTRTPIFTLADPAVSVDRARLDSLLAEEFQKRGGILKENFRWTEGFHREGVVRATGRRIARNGGETKGGNGSYVGLKVHARGMPLCADVEMHFSPEGYVGLSRQRDGTVNICGLFKRNGPVPGAVQRDLSVFAPVLSEPARGKLKELDFNAHTFSAVAGISLKREYQGSEKECRIGDSICMIPPLTGNGMSLAVESAALSAPVLREYARGTKVWEEVLGEVSQRCKKRFERRLLFAAILQRLAFNRAGRGVLVSLLRTAPGVMKAWFHLTR